MEPNITFTVLTTPCALCGAVSHDHMLMMHVGDVCKQCQPRAANLSMLRHGAAVAALGFRE